MKFCPSCGAKKLRDQDQFCMNCGQRYPVVDEGGNLVADATAANAQNDASQLQDSIDKLLGVPEETPAPAPPVAAQPADLFAGDDTGTAPPRQAAPPEDLFAAPVEPTQPEDLFATQQQPAPAVEQRTPPAESQYTAPVERQYTAPVQATQPADLFATQPEPSQPQDLFSDSVLEDLTPPVPAAQEPVWETVNADTPVGEAAWEPAQQDPVRVLPEQEREELPAGAAAGSGSMPQAAAQRQQANHSQQLGQQPAAQQGVAAQPRAQAPGQHAPQAGGTDQWKPLQPTTGTLQDLYKNESRPRQKPPQVQLPPEDGKGKGKGSGKRKGGAGRGVLLVLLLVLLFAIGVLGTTVGMLYFNNSSSKAIDGFMEALESGDINEIRSSITLTDVTVSEQGMLAFADAFREEAARDTLRSQLESQAKGNDPTSVYEAVEIESEPLFLFVKRYKIRVHGVDILAPNAGDGDLTLYSAGDNMQMHSGESTASGVVFSNLMPGQYQYSFTNTSGEVLTGSISAFKTSTVNVLGDAGGNAVASGDPATVTVENCASDDAVLYVAGVQVENRPVNGVVTIPNVTPGSEIRIVANTAEGEKTAIVVFSDPAQTTLRFNYDGDGAATGGGAAAALSSAEINVVLADYYQSYLEAINNQTPDSLRHSTASNTANMRERITSDNNAANTFEYVGASCAPDSIVATESSITFNALFQFRYMPRVDGVDATDSSNRQTVQLVQEDGEWRVNRMEFVDQEKYDSNELAF